MYASVQEMSNDAHDTADGIWMYITCTWLVMKFVLAEFRKKTNCPLFF